jgi:hypothetical protein
MGEWIRSSVEWGLMCHYGFEPADNEKGNTGIYNTVYTIQLNMIGCIGFRNHNVVEKQLLVLEFELHASFYF